MSPKIVQKHSKTLFTGNIRKIPFSILIATQREMHQSKKGQRKNLAQAIYYKDTPKGTLQNVSSGHAGRTNTQCQTQYFLLAPIYYCKIRLRLL